ncbi:MAG TPA: hypothetical protein VK186_18575 [Candidatus Deferrimicrobium sp.]|nr:hypothetical protein [Candidatus Kapabacteria bacterium]HLP60853.1 hypothetical protein [Candidatus Deferrimicrobium sp.]
MRRIDKDKSKILSTEYKKKVDKLDNAGKKHRSPSWEYCIDVVMNLLHCQGGVCAYTEMRLCGPRLIEKENWQEGRYKKTKSFVDECGNILYKETKSRKIGKFGSLEHFDPRLKAQAFWDWDNLFVIHTDINIDKNDADVDYILKPDLPGYDPFELLAYNKKTNCFVAHPDRSEDERKRITKMISLLQLNHETVHYEREEFLNEVQFKEKMKEPFKVDRFFTAYAMAMSRDKSIPRRGSEK